MTAKTKGKDQRKERKLKTRKCRGKVKQKQELPLKSGGAVKKVFVPVVTKIKKMNNGIADWIFLRQKRTSLNIWGISSLERGSHFRCPCFSSLLTVEAL